MDFPLLAGLVLALIVAILVVGGVAGFVTTAVNRELQRRRENTHCADAVQPSTSH